MTALDTGICAPESPETLLFQQRQLYRGRRAVQMFPIGTDELPLPDGCERLANGRGVFHFRPEMISDAAIRILSADGRENSFLNLGPYSKSDIAARALLGEAVTCVTEFTPSGVEVRCAAATNGTVAEQYAYFDETKEPDGIVVIGQLPSRVINAVRG